MALNNKRKEKKRKKRKTYLGEFCAHEDEENQSQELARRLHLLPPVCVDQRSHMQIESLCVPPHSSPFLPDLFCVATRSILLWCIMITIMFSLSSPAAESDRSVSRSRLCAYSSHIGSLSPAPLPSVFAAPHLFIAATDWDEHWAKDAQTLSYTQL